MIEQLLECLKPPERPYYNIQDKKLWKEADERLGVNFPSDYKQFIGTYGSGNVGDFIVFFNPFAPIERNNFFNNVQFVIGGQTKFRGIPFPLFPKSGGLLPFAKTYDGDDLFWETRGESDKWSIVVLEVRSTHYEKYPMKMVDFLTKLLKPASDNEPDILLQSEIFEPSFDRDAPFISNWVSLDIALGNIKRLLIKEKNKNNIVISREALEELLHKYLLKLDTDLVQQYLNKWDSENFITLSQEDDVYLRIL